MTRAKVCAAAIALSFSAGFSASANVALAAQAEPQQAVEQNTTASDYDVIYAPAMAAEEATQAVLTEITATSERQVAVGDYGVIVTRATASEEWQQAEVPSSVFLTSIDFANANLGWAVGHHGVILQTTDGGVTWQRQLDGFEYINLQVEHYEQRVAELEARLDSATEMDPVERDDLEFALDDALFKYDSAQIALEEGPTKPFLDVLALSEQEIFVAGAYGAFLHSTDGGATWQIIDHLVDNLDGFHLNAIQAHGDAVYMVGESGLLYRSLDRGQSWETLDSPYYGSFFGVHIDQQERLWIYGLRGNIFVSEDQGDSFTQLSLEDPVNINNAIDAPDGGLYFVGNAGVVAYLSESGELVERTHDSGAALTDLVINADGSLTLVGQRGILTMPSSALAEKE
ncbi:WD40/YVTN/BNR-like repeat-containing protein [Pseudidiomarina homiensis]|uniref:WD40/YVTN/BNR-like repeat-containing protein n=1 Tax=Pseudidiomarina homiensis TaxID=364198 RepID=UPI00215B0052|nr:YCF48-related protein [Pseudidiomarina homiensis]